MIAEPYDTQELAQLIERKHACLLRLRALGAQQSAFIAEDSLSDLLRLLAVKQAVIDQLQQVERQLDPYRQQDPEARRWPTPQARAHCAQLAAQCQQMLDELLLREREGEEQLRLRRNAAASRLAGAHQAAQAWGAYAESLPPAPASLDLSSGE